MPLLSALSEAFGLSTVCLNQPLSYPQIYEASYCFLFEYTIRLAPSTVSSADPFTFTSHARIETFSEVIFLYTVVLVK